MPACVVAASEDKGDWFSGTSPLAPPCRIETTSEVEVPLKAEHETRCNDCGGRIRVGEDMHFLPPMPGLKAECRHVVCPEKKPSASTATRTPRPKVDHEDLFHYRKCSREGVRWNPDVKWERAHMNVCGKYLTVPKAQAAPRECPYCGAGLLRPHPSEPGWVPA